MEGCIFIRRKRKVLQQLRGKSVRSSRTETREVPVLRSGKSSGYEVLRRMRNKTVKNIIHSLFS